MGILIGCLNLKDQYFEVLLVKIAWKKPLKHLWFYYCWYDTILFLRALGQNSEVKPQAYDLLIENRHELIKLIAKQ